MEVTGTRMKNISVVIFYVFLFFFSCTQNKTESVAEKETSDSIPVLIENISPAGVYSGIVPCADCIGLEYTLYLQPDSTYFLRQTYYKEPISKHIMVDSGRWIEAANGTIELEYGESKILFREEKNSLLMLDADGKEITDVPANFRLARIGRY
mgnify:CR=1 FL=1